MRRKLLIVALTTAMVATLLTGCGEKDDTKESNTTTPATKVEQSDNNNANSPTSNEEDTKKEDSANKEEVKGYEEKFYDEPNWEEEYEENVSIYMFEGDSESVAKERAEKSMKKNILEYEVSKYVFEDMTQKFKNKEEVSVTDSINLMGMRKDCEGTSLVCDVSEMVPEGSPYTAFGGFNAKKTECLIMTDNGELDYVNVVLAANKISGDPNPPIYVTLHVDVNEDGTYSYRELSIQYMLD